MICFGYALKCNLVEGWENNPFEIFGDYEAKMGRDCLIQVSS